MLTVYATKLAAWISGGGGNIAVNAGPENALRATSVTLWGKEGSLRRIVRSEFAPGDLARHRAIINRLLESYI